MPDVECVNVLRKVPELQCTPEVYEDCNAVEKKVPYLEPQEDCVEVTFDECQEVVKSINLSIALVLSYEHLTAKLDVNCRHLSRLISRRAFCALSAFPQKQ